MFLRNMRNLILVMAPVMLFVFVYSHFFQKPKDPVTYVGVGDAAMTQAKAQGRATVPEFLQHLKNPAADEDHFVVKFRLDRKQLIVPARTGPQDEAPDEYIWANRLNLVGDGSVLLGFINDEPRTKGFYNGQPLRIDVDDIVDWGYSKAGVMQGNFTTKVLLSKLSAREAAQARQAMGWR
jgi:uncharacterized protein YegJ (DUF2314 family)